MKIFLGYASEHEAAARDVYALLIGTGSDVWFDKESLLPGDDWDQERANAQANADLIVHLVSAEVVARRGVVNREIRATLRLAEDQPFGSLFAVFLRLEDFRVPVDLLRYHYVNKFEDPWREKLLQAVEKRKQQLKLGLSRSTRQSHEEAVKAVLPVGNGTYVVEERTIENERIEASTNFIQYVNNGLYWDFINAKLKSHSLGEYFRNVHDLETTYTLGSDWIKQRGLPLAWTLSTEEFFQEDEYVSIRQFNYIDHGGAHPNHFVSTMNFLGEWIGECRLNYLLDDSDVAVEKILTYCKKVISAQFGEDGGSDPFFETTTSEMAWNALSEFNFDRRGLTFNFSPYVLLPYVYGTQEILVPWSFLEEFLNKEFSLRANGLFRRF